MQYDSTRYKSEEEYRKMKDLKESLEGDGTLPKSHSDIEARREFYEALYPKGRVLIPEEGLSEFHYIAFHKVMASSESVLKTAIQEAIHLGVFDERYRDLEDILLDMVRYRESI